MIAFVDPRLSSNYTIVRKEGKRGKLPAPNQLSAGTF
jgi:hypothetical protein